MIGGSTMTVENISGEVLTVLGPVPANELGIVLVNETLLSVYPGAEYAPEITIDRSEVFEILKNKMLDFKRLGGKTIVDQSGMFHGRDVWLYETLSKTTGIHIIASTGLGPEKLLSGYFTAPQTNPPTPWPGEKFAGLFIKEIQQGIPVPRVERAGQAGLVTSVATATGITEIEENLFRGCGLTSLETGVAVSVQYGADAVHDLNVILNTGIEADRVIIGSVDRLDAVANNEAEKIAQKGAFVAINHVGWGAEDGYINDTERVELIKTLIDKGYVNQILISSSAVGVAKGHSASDLSYSYMLEKFVPQLVKAGVSQQHIRTILEQNPQRILATTKANVVQEKEVYTPL